MSLSFRCGLICSDNPYLSAKAKEYAQRLFDIRCFGTYERQCRRLGDEVEQVILSGEIDFLFSFLCPVMVKKSLLKSVAVASINFHPAPVKYPGVGSASYAIYNEDTRFGVTAHVMEEKADSGTIIASMNFDILATDTCESLFNRAMHYSLSQFYEVLFELSETGKVYGNGEQWGRKALTRSEFERWMMVSLDDELDEVWRKIKALEHSRAPGPFVEVRGQRIDLHEAIQSGQWPDVLAPLLHEE
jgi:methionyl-tRNA formyltransferase